MNAISSVELSQELKAVRKIKNKGGSRAAPHNPRRKSLGPDRLTNRSSRHRFAASFRRCDMLRQIAAANRCGLTQVLGPIREFPVNATEKNIRWPVIFVATIALITAIACIVFWPVIKQQTQKTEPGDALQAFIEGGDFNYPEDRTKKILSVLPYDSISIDHSPCFGPCPIFTATFYKDGHASLITSDWQSHTKKYFTGKISTGDYVRLTQIANVARKAALHNEYAAQWTDDSTISIELASKNSTWKVSDYGRVAPVEVWALEQILSQYKEKTDWSPTSGP